MIHVDKDGKCGQLAINSSLVPEAKILMKAIVGPCSDDGYTVDNGPKQETVPVLGTVTFEEFLKPSLKSDTLIHVDKNGKCGQLAINSSLVPEAKILMSAIVGPCSDEGYTIDNGPKQETVPVLGTVTFEEFLKPSLNERVKGDTLIHVDKDGKCGQLAIADSLVSTAKLLMHAIVGPCSDEGYTIDNGPKQETVPVLGTVTFEEFLKPSLNQALFDIKGDTMIHVLRDNKCGQLAIADSLVASAKLLMGAKVGTCPSDGYTVDNGPK